MSISTKIQRVKEQGIHPSLGKLLYLTEGEFEYFKKLKKEFCNRAANFLQQVQGSDEESIERPEEQRSLTTRKVVKPSKGFIYQKEAICWRWQRVKEYYDERTSEERYEKLLKGIKT